MAGLRAGHPTSFSRIKSWVGGSSPSLVSVRLFLDEIPEPPVTALDMPAHGGFCARAIAGANGGDDGVMLVHRLFGDLAPETGAEDMDMDMQPRQGIRDQV